VEYERKVSVGATLAAQLSEGNATALLTDCLASWHLSVPRNEHFDCHHLAELTAKIQTPNAAKTCIADTLRTIKLTA